MRTRKKSHPIIIKGSAYPILEKVATLSTEEFKTQIIDKGYNTYEKDYNGMTPFLLAIKLNKIALVKLLLKEPETNVTEQNREGMNALHLAAQLQEDSFVMVHLLLQQGIDPTIKDSKGNISAHYSKSEAVKNLLTPVTYIATGTIDYGTIQQTARNEGYVRMEEQRRTTAEQQNLCPLSCTIL